MTEASNKKAKLNVDGSSGSAPQAGGFKPPSDPALHKYMELFPEELEDMVDCVVRAGEDEFPAHAVVLFAQSKVLAGLKGLSSKHSRGNCKHEIRLEETAADTALLLWHIYGVMTNQPHSARWLNYEDAASLAGIADRLGMIGIKAHVEDVLLKDNDEYLLYVEESEVVKMWLLADRYNFTTFRAHCEVCVAERFRSFIGMKEVREISGPSLARAAYLYMREREEGIKPSEKDLDEPSLYMWQ